MTAKYHNTTYHFSIQDVVAMREEPGKFGMVLKHAGWQPLSQESYAEVLPEFQKWLGEGPAPVTGQIIADKGAATYTPAELREILNPAPAPEGKKAAKNQQKHKDEPAAE